MSEVGVAGGGAASLPSARVPAELDSLAADLSPGSVLGPDDDLTGWAQPWRGPAGRAAFVLRPGSLDEVRTVLRWAVRHRRPLVPQGARTGLVGASVPGPAGTTGVLSTERLTAPLVLHEQDRAVTAGAGVLMSSIETACTPAGLELPIDLSADPSVGGLVATNAGGCRVLRHGDVRRRVLGLQVVLADDDATVLGDLRPLRKKNDSLRLTDLLVGSAGLLGVVTAATLELSPRPTGRATAIVRPAGSVVACAAALIRALGPALGALELVSATAVELTVSRLDEVVNPFVGDAFADVLLVEAEVHGTADATEVLLKALDAVGGVVEDAVLLPVADAWALRHGVSEALSRAGAVLGLDVSVPRGALVAVREATAAVVRRSAPGAVLADFGHLGDGGLHLNIVLPPGIDGADGADPGTVAVAATLRHEVYALVTAHGGSFSAEHGLGPANLAWWIEHTDPAEVAALRAVKAALDPYGLLGTDDLRVALTSATSTAATTTTAPTTGTT